MRTEKTKLSDACRDSAKAPKKENTKVGNNGHVERAGRQTNTSKSRLK